MISVLITFLICFLPVYKGKYGQMSNSQFTCSGPSLTTQLPGVTNILSLLVIFN